MESPLWGKEYGPKVRKKKWKKFLMSLDLLIDSRSDPFYILLDVVFFETVSIPWMWQLIAFVVGQVVWPGPFAGDDKIWAVPFWLYFSCIFYVWLALEDPVSHGDVLFDDLLVPPFGRFLRVLSQIRGCLLNVELYQVWVVRRFIAFRCRGCP